MADAKVAVVQSVHLAPLAALGLALVFSAGLAAGVSLPRTPGDPGQAAVSGSIKPFVGVAFNNMSDAALAALYGPKPFKGVADNNMSDAARRALYGQEP